MLLTSGCYAQIWIFKSASNKTYFFLTFHKSYFIRYFEVPMWDVRPKENIIYFIVDIMIILFLNPIYYTLIVALFRLYHIFKFQN